MELHRAKEKNKFYNICSFLECIIQLNEGGFGSASRRMAIEYRKRFALPTNSMPDRVSILSGIFAMRVA